MSCKYLLERKFLLPKHTDIVTEYSFENDYLGHLSSNRLVNLSHITLITRVFFL